MFHVKITNKDGVFFEGEKKFSELEPDQRKAFGLTHGVQGKSNLSFGRFEYKSYYGHWVCTHEVERTD